MYISETDIVVSTAAGYFIITSVAACGPCNVKKADSLFPRPIREPKRPTWFQINHASTFHDIHIPDANWKNYIKWPEEKLHLADNITLY